jgi:quinol-cytochrome oxidoreductase complex cytochrome b subunit
MTNSLILHTRPALVSVKALRFTHTFGLGGMALVLFLLLVATGLLMIFVYEPSPVRAYESVLFMQQEILFGRLIRGVHYWSANLLIAVVALHILRVFLTGAFHGRRRSNWLIGLCLLFLILLSGFTGYLLPWDQISFWAITICTEMLGYIPGIGEALQRIILGGTEIGSATMINFYALHTIVVPLSLVGLMTWHFWLVRRAGGVILPRTVDDNFRAGFAQVPYNPNLMWREIGVGLTLIAFVIVLAIFFEAPLGEPANPGLSPNPAKAPWYFVGLQELLVHFHPLFAVFVIPLLLVCAIVGVAYLQFDTPLSGSWFLSLNGRRIAIIAAGTAMLFIPLWILLDEFAVGPGGWVPGAAAVISSGLVPFVVFAAAIVAFYGFLKRFFSASKSEAVQAIFVLLAVSFIVLTVTGTWFRGAGMALVWPWQT